MRYNYRKLRKEVNLLAQSDSDENYVVERTYEIDSVWGFPNQTCR